NINLRLAESAKHMNIGLGLGSLRYILESDSDLSHLRKIREKAGEVPILANIGIAQVIELREYSKIQKIISELNADSFVVHLNPVQELLQKNGQYNFAGLIKSLERFITAVQIPIIVKEVGSGISKKVAKQLLEINIKGIDVAGAGGTSWAAVEILRNNDSLNNDFWDWGLPTSYCIRKVNKLKKDYDFLLIGSGGINNPIEIAKALALGADITASARIILQTLISKGEEGVTALISDWFNTVKKIMYLTGSESIEHFQKNKIAKTKDLI
nr:alpha-hydroxy-acid oxidizing protein [Ignavibacteriaceae bacterium]